MSVAVIDQQGGLIGVEVSCADFVLRLAKETDIALIKYHGCIGREKKNRLVCNLIFSFSTATGNPVVGGVERRLNVRSLNTRE